MTRLRQLPQHPWQAAREPVSLDMPFVPLLGTIAASLLALYSQLDFEPVCLAPFFMSSCMTAVDRAAGHFRSAPSDAGRRVMQAIAEEDNNSKEEAVWLVYKWEGLQPLSHYAAAAQSPQGPGLFSRGVGRLWGSQSSSDQAAQTALQNRCAMVRCAQCPPMLRA